MKANSAISFCGLGLFLGILTAATAGAAEPPAPGPFLERGDAAGFLPLANKFLKENPQHLHAAQTAWECFQLARIARESKEGRDALLRLIADYPDSPPARHTLAQMSASEFARLLKECFRHLDVDDQPAGAERIVRAYRLGDKHFENQFGDNELIFQIALALGEQGWAELIPRLKSPDKETVQISMIARNGKLSSKEKLLALQELKDNETAKGFQRLLFPLLTAEERDTPFLAGIIAHDLASEGEFSPACKLFAKICREGSQWESLYPWALAEAAQGHGKEAAELLKRLVKECESPSNYARLSQLPASAANLIPIFQNLDANLAEQDKLAGELAAALQKNLPELVELKLDASKSEELKYVGWLRLDLKDESAQIMAEVGGQLVAALETSAQTTRVFLLNHPQIRQYAERAGYPALQLEIVNHLDGTGRFNFGISLGESNQGKLRHSIENLLTSPQLFQADARQRMARFALQGGFFPAGINTENGERIATWIHADPEKGKLGTVEFRISPDNRLSSVTTNGVTLHIRYGPSGQPQLRFPAWPTLPVEKLAELKETEFFRIFGKAAKLVMDLAQKAEAELAERKRQWQG
jgi:hypothetical protein